MPKRGSMLLLAIFFLAFFLSMTILFMKIVYNTYSSGWQFLRREQTFWLAESGLEYGKVRLAENPAWYTDLPHQPENDLTWLRQTAKGKTVLFGGGSFKVVREQSKSFFYALGMQGQGLAALKIKFTNSPYKTVGWEEI